MIDESISERVITENAETRAVLRQYWGVDEPISSPDIARKMLEEIRRLRTAQQEKARTSIDEALRRIASALEQQNAIAESNIKYIMERDRAAEEAVERRHQQLVSCASLPFPCPVCRGSGRIGDSPCDACTGKGTVWR